MGRTHYSPIRVKLDARADVDLPRLLAKPHHPQRRSEPVTTPQVDQATGRLPARVGVLGGGRMGGGIAHAFLMAGAEVTVVERDEESAAAARERIERDIAASLRRGVVDKELAHWSNRLSLSTERSTFAGCGLVIEAVPEVESLKSEALADVEGHLAEDAWLASNTSSISIDALADYLRRPERFLGLHFFNPVPVSRLVEVVVGRRTSTELRKLAPAWTEALGKTPVVVADAPGFASSRLGVAIALEAIRMVEEGVADPAAIDVAMELGYKHPVGPLKLTDIVGLDVRLGIAEYLHERLGERFAPPQLMRDMVARGDLGRKSGRGFYGYSDEH